MKDLLYICVKNPFSERDRERMGIDALESHFDVRILDCTAWLMPKAFGSRGVSPVSYRNLSTIRSFRELKKELFGQQRGGFALDYVGPFSLNAIRLFNQLKAHGVKLIVLDSGAYPSPALTLRKRTRVEKLMAALRHGGIRLHVNSVLIKLWLKFLPDQTPDYALVAGTSWKADPRFCRAKEKISAHSFDYETYLHVRHQIAQRSKDYAVYLDEVIAGHEDNQELGLAEPATAERFYPALAQTLDAFEAATGLPVLIAGYPSLKSENHQNFFGGRDVIYGQTAILIRDAKFVFAHASTAISFAVLWRRPIVFLTSSEIVESWYQPWIEAPKQLLKAPLLNLDDINLQIDPGKWAVIDEPAYAAYEATYIKSADSPGVSLWERLSCVKAPINRVHEERCT